MLSDFKYALRQARKAPGFTIIAILILGIGIGATTVVFTLIDAVLVRGLPVRDPSQLVLASNVQTLAAASQVREQFSYPTYALFRDRAKSLAGVLAAGRSSRVLASDEVGQDQGIPVQSGDVSGNFFSLLGVAAIEGRTLVPDDDSQDSPHAVVVLSYGLWQRKFGAAPKSICPSLPTPFADRRG